MKKDDMLNKTFGKLTVLKRVENYKDGHIKYLCKCDCGNETTITGRDIRTSKIRSCGCLQKERKGENSNLYKHGLRNTPEYKTWASIKTRCYNKNSENYKNYGSRGIMMCDRWLNSPVTFIEDMGKRPNSDYSIDRIDVNGNYEPSNCRWVSKSDQAINRRYKKGNLYCITKNYNKYTVQMRRKGNVRNKSFVALEDAINTRDLWFKEYKENPDIWIENTINKNF